jgi:hypothetical protein
MKIGSQALSEAAKDTLPKYPTCSLLFGIGMLLTDTLLNVFIAIAVDNLAEAHAMTAAELEKEKRLKKLVSSSSLPLSSTFVISNAVSFAVGADLLCSKRQT